MRGIIIYCRSLLQNLKGYWILIDWKNKVFFIISQGLFTIRRIVEEFTTNTSIVFQIFISALNSVIFSILVSILLLAINFLFYSDEIRNKLSLNLPGTDFIFDLFSFKAINSYDGLLIAIITVIGLFLTLHLTNLGTIAGNLYTILPNRLRRLYIKERVGNIYIRYLVFIIILSLLLLGYGVILNIRSRFLLIILGFLCTFSIQAFVNLNQRSYELFDPTLLANTLNGQLAKWIKNATFNGYRWKDRNFQNHYMKKAYDLLEGVSSLVQISRDSEYLKHESYSSLLANIKNMCLWYLKEKKKIPFGSLWYRQKPEHTPYYLSDYTKTNLAVRTNIEKFPEMIPDINWFEKLLLDHQINGLKDFINQQRKDFVISTLDNISDIFKAIGKEWEIPFGSVELSKISSIIDQYILEQKAKELSSYSSEELGIVEYFGFLPIVLLVELRQSIDNWDFPEFWENLNNLNWENSKEFLKINLPPQINKVLEKIQKQTEFEKTTEGQVISAPWYHRQLVSHAIAENFLNQLNTLFAHSSKIYLLSEKWINNKQFIYSAELIKRGLEFFDKFFTYLEVFSLFFDELEKEWLYKFAVTPEINVEKLRKDSTELVERLYISYAQCIPGLSLVKRSKEIPDYFGRAIFVSSNQLLMSLIQNDLDKFRNLFSYLFVGMHKEHDLLKADTSDWETEQGIRAYIQPLIDLIEFSGYSFFFSELHQNEEYWNYCKNYWDNFLEKDPTYINYLASVISFNKNPLHTSIRQTSRQQILERILRGMPRVTGKPDTYYDFPGYPSRIDHPSNLVKLFGGLSEDFHFLHYDGIDLFVEFYLKKRSESDDLNFGRESGLIDALERHIENNETDSN